jgi:hypothetical protein
VNTVYDRHGNCNDINDGDYWMRECDNVTDHVFWMRGLLIELGYLFKLKPDDKVYGVLSMDINRMLLIK